MDAVKTSKFPSLILRHQPPKVGWQLDAQGWDAVNELLDALQLWQAEL